MPSSPTTPLQLTVAAADMLNPLIRQLRLRPPEGGALPGFEAGAHVRVQVHLPGGATDWRHYSLVNPHALAQATAAPGHYTIAVRREDAGRGGSRFMHALAVGDMLAVEPPRNDFPLAAQDGQEGRTLLVAGGIGVTPLLGMAAQCKARGRPVRMVYAGRAREAMAYLPELRDLLGDALTVHADAQAGAPLDVAALVDGCAADERLYICGPQALLDAVLAAAAARGWAEGRVRFELFSPPAPQAGEHAFELVLAQSAKSYTVAAGQSILDCLLANGCDPLFDCRRGECGLCAVPVLEGEIDHRDYALTAAERAAGNVIQICISRAKGQRLVLDL